MKVLWTALLVLFTTTGFSQKHVEAKEYLSKARKAIENHTNQQITFDYAMDRPTSNGKKTISYEGKLTVSGDKYRLEMNGFTYLSDGTKMYIISHDDEEITTTELDQESEAPITPSAILKGFDKGYSYKLAGLETVGKRKVQYVILKPNVNEEVREITLGIFIDDFSVYTFQRMGMNDVDIRFTVKTSAWDVKTLDSYLTFDPTEFDDYTIFD